MKRVFLILFVLALLPLALRAQSVGQVRYGDQVFSTGLPDGYQASSDFDEETGEEIGVHMPAERRKKALECIERSFGSVKDYKEGYNGCQGGHILSVTLTHGDKLEFEDGCLKDFYIVTSRFTIDSDMFPGGLRVGRKPPVRANQGVVLRQDEKDPNSYQFWWENSEVYGHYLLDENGRIKEIWLWTNDC
jgi:hypothetical protein